MMGRSGKFWEKLKEPGKSNLQVGPIVVTFARSFTPRLATTELKAGFRRGRQEARHPLELSLPLVFGPEFRVAPSLAEGPVRDPPGM
jgi:hypothetical protein